MPLAIASLKADLADHCPQVELIGEAGGVMEAAKLIKNAKADLLFLDIEMGDGDGFDLLEIIERDGIQVVMTTGSREYAIKAFRFEVLDYLTKPINSDSLVEAVQKACTRIYGSSTQAHEDLPSTITVNTHELIKRIPIDEISRLEAVGNYTTIYFGESQKIMTSKTIKTYEDQLPDHFLRVHQSHIVNQNRIEAYVKTEGGYLRMIDGSTVPVAVRKKSWLMDRLAK